MKFLFFILADYRLYHLVNNTEIYIYDGDNCIVFESSRHQLSI